MRSFKKKKYIYTVAVSGVVILITFLSLPGEKSPNKIPQNKSIIPSITETASTEAFNRSLYPVDISSSLWVVVNKGRVLSKSYVPDELRVPNILLRYSAASSEMKVRSDAASALEQMSLESSKTGVGLRLASGYRSYYQQSAVYTGYVKSDGAQQADTFSARPGHSEHQTGLVADLEPSDRSCELEVCFGQTPAGKWLAENSHKYGFIIRYQQGKQSQTGYQYEPWHIRYVGKELAAQINASGQTLEQFFGLPSYSTYPAQMLTLKDK